jgi:hypothetical protein
MPIIKEIIKSNNLDMNIKFSLGSGNSLLGYQQEVDNLTEETKDILINPVVDAEVRKFIYDSSVGATNLKFYFLNQSNVQTNSFLAAGFTPLEILNSNVKLLNSFFILDYYNTYNNNTQTRIFTNYLTKVLGANVSNLPNYSIINTTINQFYSWYVPQSYIDIQTGTTVTGYVKFSFYNAKTGRIALFFNKQNQTLLTPEKMYFKTQLNLNNKTWKFIASQPIEVYELSSASAYVTKVNNTIGSFENKKQQYPTGNTFQTTDGNYVME